MIIINIPMKTEKYLYLLKDQMDIDLEYQKSISKVFKADVPVYNNEKLYRGAIKSISEKSGIPEDDLNFFIYDQDFGMKSRLTIEDFVEKWKL